MCNVFFDPTFTFLSIVTGIYYKRKRKINRSDQFAHIVFISLIVREELNKSLPNTNYLNEKLRKKTNVIVQISL